MKIIQSSRRPKKDDSSSATDKRADYAHTVSIDSSPEVSELKSESWKAKSKKKPRIKESSSRSSKKRSKFLNDGCQPSLDKAVPEEEFEFDTSNLEAMPKNEVFEGPTQGKTRRKSELQAEKASEPLSLVTDPAKQQFNELFARGLRLLAMREHSVKEITKKLFDKSEGYLTIEGSFSAKSAGELELGDETEALIYIESHDEGESSARAEISTTIYAVIDELLERKYLSDERFTEVYIRSRSTRGFGPVKIKAELKSKGVSNNLIQDYLDEGAASWFDNAQSQYQKKYGEAPISDYNSWTKRARFMQSRGFTMEHIHVTVPRVEFD